MNITEEELLQQLNNKKIREYAPAIAFSAIVGFFGILGNAFSVAFYGFKVPRTTTNVIITALSSVDLITCILLSDEIIELCFTLTFKNVVGCKAIYFFNRTFVVTSGFLLLLVAIDRYRRLCFPFRRQISVNAAKICFLLIVIFATAISFRDWVILDVLRVEVFDSANGANVTAFYCTHSNADSLKTTVRVFQIIDLIACLTVIVSLIILYSFMAKALWKTRKRLNSNDIHCVISFDVPNGSDTITAVPSTCRNPSKYVIKTLFPNVDESSAESLTFTHGSAVNRPTNNTVDGVLEIQGNGLHDNESHKTTSDSTEDISDIDINVRTDRPSNIDQGRDNTNAATHRDDHTFPEQTKRNEHNEVTKADRKMTFMLFTITAAFLISSIPYFIVNVGIKPENNSLEQEFSVGIQIALRSFMVNNAINAYVIGLFNSRFREFVKRFVCQLCDFCQH